VIFNFCYYWCAVHENVLEVLGVGFSIVSQEKLNGHCFVEGNKAPPNVRAIAVCCLLADQSILQNLSSAAQFLTGEGIDLAH
jgi:hypothetical protein